MKYTIRDVARRAGVGPTTVSRVLNHSPLVTKETRQRVEAAIAALNFVPNPTARRLSLGKTQTIAAIVPFFTRPSAVERLRGVDSALAESQYDLIVFNVESVERRDRCFREVPRPDRADGVIIVSFTPTDEQAAGFLRSGVPVVLLDARHPALPSVMEDSVAGGRQATEHLIQLGHRRIGYLSDVFDDPFNYTSRSRFRYVGYRAALEAAGLDVAAHYQRQGEHGRETARQMAAELLDLPEPPTAIFAASDTQAMGVLEAARDRGLRVPEDLSVVGYDDLEVAEYLGLTTVRQALFESGRQSVACLWTAMAGEAGRVDQVTLPTELVIRRTTAAPPRERR